MKYTDTNKPLVCMMTNSTCYEETSKMTIKGVLWHSTGANNPNLKRYVQPSESDPNYNALIAKLGRNSNGNSWNDIYIEAGLNGWIGKLADGAVASIQTMPWDYKPWGCGSGRNGSCNNGWIQFEICEDGLNDKAYFDKVYKEACELTAYLCKKYNLNPKGTATCGNVKCPVILCHADSYSLGLGSNHGDVNHWFSRYGKSMDTVRADVAALINASKPAPSNPTTPVTPATPSIKPGDINKDGNINTIDAQQLYNHVSGKTKLTGDSLKAADYNEDGKVNIADVSELFNTVSGKKPTKEEAETFRIRKTWADAASQKGAFTDLSNAKKACDNAGVGYKVYNSKGQVVYTTTIPTKPATFSPYQVIVTADRLNVRSGPSTNLNINTTVRKNEIFTIIEEKNGWGKLKSGAGWIALEYTKKR